MSNAIRKIERGCIKREAGGGAKFESAWKKYREEKYAIKDEEGNVVGSKMPRNTMPRKQQHFDNIEQYNKLFSWMDNFALNLLKGKNTDIQEESGEVDEK